MKENPALIAIDFVDKDSRRVMGLPSYVERPQRLPPITDPLITEAIQRCHVMKIPVYSHVIEQFAPLWVLAIPVSDETANAGVVLATYDLDQLLSSQVPWWFVKRYDLSLVDRDNKQLSPREDSVPGPISDVHKLNFGPDNSGLSLRASPHAAGYSEKPIIWLSAAVIVFGVLIIWLLRLLQRWLRERQAAQQALVSSRAQLYAVLSGLDAAVYVSRISDAQLLFRNRHHANLFQFKADGDCCLIAWPGLPHDTEFDSLEFRDGDRWYHLERRTILWVDDSPVLLDIATDITVEREAQDTARERDELLQHTARLSTLAEFATGIAHELNQPLSAISNYSAVASAYLETEPLQIEKIRDIIRRAGDEAVRAGKIIHSMRAHIRKRSIKHSRHNLSDLLTEPLLLLRPLSQRLQLGINVDVQDRDIIVECDAVMIEQVIFNLIRNGLEAVADAAAVAGPGQTMHEAVTVQIKREQDNVVVCVSDCGPGIKDPEKLFQPFYTTKAEGMGMGLAICRTVIESHGGKLWGEANQVGGANFYFKLRCITSQNEVQSTDNEVTNK
jgi:signal transduction histidine kinase